MVCYVRLKGLPSRSDSTGHLDLCRTSNIVTCTRSKVGGYIFHFFGLIYFFSICLVSLRFLDALVPCSCWVVLESYAGIGGVTARRLGIARWLLRGGGENLMLRWYLEDTLEGVRRRRQEKERGGCGAGAGARCST
jgi:hypothetical protein